MPTSLVFSSQYASDGNIWYSQSGNDVTVTASVDDGVISVGDQVTFTGLDVLVYSDAEIFTDTAFYLGTGTFNGQTGYVFTVDGNLTDPDQVLVLTHETLETFDTNVAVDAYAKDTSSQSLTNDPACFLAGVRIATAEGPRAVEDLRPGDQILTADGQPAAVKWVGRQTVSTVFGPADRLMPVRVTAGALGDGRPERDLTLTADHALLIDGVLVNAGAVVNGTSIYRVPLSEFGQAYTVYHVETEGHVIILAEGTPAETFIDYVGRQAFDNYAEYLALYGQDQEIAEMPLPRVSSARQVPPQIRARLNGKQMVA